MAFHFMTESLRMAYRSIVQRKLRSALTATGIVIGIAAVIAMVSIGEGTNSYIQEQFEQLGANKIIISSMSFGGGGAGGFFSNQRLRQNDVDLVKSVRGIEKAIPMLYSTYQVTHKDVTLSQMIIGINSREAQDLFEGSQMGIKQGRWLRPGDKHVVTIGKLVAEENFGEELGVRDKLVIEEETFEVVGIMNEIGNSQDDSQIYMPLETLKEISGTGDEISAIYAQAFDESQVEAVAERVQTRLDNKYGEDVFYVMSTSSLAGRISGIMGTLSAVLAGIAAIALVVAGIGIANTMYMSTMERTREIGIMKSVGATNANVLQIFLTEAAAIGFVGGLIGVLLGIGASKIVGFALEASGFPLKAEVTAEVAALGVCFAVVTGVASGLLPARKASMIDPIEALRYE